MNPVPSKVRTLAEIAVLKCAPPCRGAGLAVCFLLSVFCFSAAAQTTAFTYQGRLEVNGLPANGLYDFGFGAWNAPTGGAQLAGVNFVTAVPVSNGQFTTTVDFGPGLFTGGDLWLQILARPNNSGSYTTLSPRQRFTSAPYAVHAATAVSAGISATAFGSVVSFTNAANQFAGNGAGLTNLNVSALRQSVGSLTVWGNNASGQASPPAGLNNLVAVAGGSSHSLALRSDGTVLAWGNNSFNQLNIPFGLANVAKIAAAYRQNLVLRSNGTVVTWGGNGTSLPAGLTDIMAIAQGEYHGLAVRSNGTVVAWGSNTYGEGNVPAGLVAVAVAAGTRHSVALRSNGTVVAWGANTSGQTNVPPGLNNVIAIAANRNHSLALRGDGTVVAWGSNDVGETVVPGWLNNVTAIAAGETFSMARRSDGSVVIWGSTEGGLQSIPAGATSVLAIGAGGGHALAVSGLNSGVALLQGGNVFQGTQAILNGNLGVGTDRPQARLHVYGAENPVVLRLHSAGTPGFGRLEFVSDPQGSVNEWRPGYIEATDAGGFTGGLAFYVNGTGAGSKFGSNEVMRIQNGRVGIGTNNPTTLLQVGNATCNGTTWINASDRALKENFQPVDTLEVLHKVAGLPLSVWNYKSQPAGGRHLGPTAQDFKAAFGLGESDTGIATVDADGVALAAIQGLNTKLESGKQKAEIRMEKLEAENAALKARLERLEQLLSQQLNQNEK
jgi:alpha-tubulin suppressor-like RCC1 family protein